MCDADSKYFQYLKLLAQMFIRIFITSYVSVSLLSTLPRFRLRTLKTEYDTRQIIIITVNIKQKTSNLRRQAALRFNSACQLPTRAPTPAG